MRVGPASGTGVGVAKKNRLLGPDGWARIPRVARRGASPPLAKGGSGGSAGGCDEGRSTPLYPPFVRGDKNTDHHIGRLLDFLKETGQFENTLIMVISDNGASSEGGPTGSINENKFFNFVPDDLAQNLAAIDDIGGPKYFNHYPWGWTWAGNTPFRRWKRETYRGGISDPSIVHWPAAIKAQGANRAQYAHAIDMVPTVLDALGIEPPTHIRGVQQAPIEGLSFAPAFDDAAAPSRRVTQYFEMLGHRSIYHDGWRAVCPWPGTSFSEGQPFGTPISRACRPARTRIVVLWWSAPCSLMTRTKPRCHLLR